MCVYVYMSSVIDAAVAINTAYRLYFPARASDCILEKLFPTVIVSGRYPLLSRNTRKWVIFFGRDREPLYRYNEKLGTGFERDTIL